MDIYFLPECDLFGDTGLAVYNSKMDLLIFLTNVHADKMEKMKLDPSNKDHIVLFLKNKYPETFKGKIKYFDK